MNVAAPSARLSITLVVFLAGGLSACDGTTAPAGAPRDVSAPPAPAAGTPRALDGLAITKCGPKPAPVACGDWVCTAGVWELVASPAGTPCIAAGVAGVCTGEDPSTPGVCDPPDPCPAGQTRCGHRCVDLAWDEGNCGACGAACPAGGRCEQGSCFPKPEVCGACVGGTQTCCQMVSADQRLCADRSCLSACAAGAVCATPASGPTCSCPGGTSCRPNCGPPICEVNWLLCLLFPPLGCLQQCSPGLCSVDSYCGSP